MAYSLVTHGEFSQGAECLPCKARGRQCVSCSLMFLITVFKVKHASEMQTEDIHDVLYAGSHLYCAMHESMSFLNLVDPQTLPDQIYYKGYKINISHINVLSGIMGENMRSNRANALYSLEDAFTYDISKHLILVFSEVAIGIHFDTRTGTYYVFDSHSRNHEGLNSHEGTSVVGAIHSLKDLCFFLRELVTSLGQNSNYVQFDMHRFHFITKWRAPSRPIQILDDRKGFQIGNKRKRKKTDNNTSDLNNMNKRQHVLNLMEGKSFSVCIDDRYAANNEERPVRGISQGIMTSEEAKLITNFHKTVAEGPNYVCSCCTQTFFRHTVSDVNHLTQNLLLKARKFLTNFKSVKNNEWVCRSCLTALRKGKTPYLWLYNGLKFPIIPIELELSNLEERLVSPRLPFMQLREMPRVGQLNLRGNIVNVPADVNSTIKSLPRMMSENETIMLKLKRKLSYKHHVIFENIRPTKVFEAAKWLVDNSVLFKNEGIVVNETWLQQPIENFVINESESIDQECGESETFAQNCDTAVNAEGNDTWTEDENFSNRLVGNLDTCLQSLDFREFNKVLCVAPGENNSPISLFQDFHSEALSFPAIYCGKARVDNSQRLVPLHYSAVCKWELRNVDRRVACCLPNIFFKLKRLQIKQIKDKVSLAVRKCKSKDLDLTAGNLLSPQFVDKLTMQNDGYRVLRTMRGSPPYWEQAKRDVFAMIRQLGTPTWFASFSAAETKWTSLLISLSKLVHNKDISIQEANDLSWQDKCVLIKSDPVTCARYFDMRVQALIRDVLKNKSHPIGEIVDFFFRVEFQQRGSPHIHMLLWVKDSPVHGESTDACISSFVDKYVTCKKDDTIPTLINYQTHRHAPTCRKKGKDVCRFNFPLFPMPNTTVLYPLEEQPTNELSERAANVTSLLNDLHKEKKDDISFEEFLKLLDLNLDTYLMLVRSTLKRASVFLKRSVCETRINSYNSLLIQCWMANMDLQFILDPYACISYIVSYISKGQRGLSNLLSDACSEAQSSDSDVRQQVRKIGNQFLSNVEIGAQEAVYLVLQLPLRRCTRKVIFVDTNQSHLRTSMIKSFSQLKVLSNDSADVEMDNVLKRYKRRPRSLEFLCYADFSAWYELCSGQQKHHSKDVLDKELPETEYEYDKDDNLSPIDNEMCDNIIRFACGTSIRRRKLQKIIYTNLSPFNKDREEHFRQKIMLYTHWRNDECDLIEGFATYEESYNAKIIEIDKNKVNYERQGLGELEHMLDIDVENLDPNVNLEAEHQETIDLCQDVSLANQFGCFDPNVPSCENVDYDLGEDLGIKYNRTVAELLPQKEVDNDIFYERIRGLNVEQKMFFYHILHMVKLNCLPFYTFLSGGAGVGKSVVTRCIHQGLMKYFNHCREEDPNTSKILLCAPTGKAAHNIGGSTIHSAFCIPANQGFQFKPLDMQQMNTMRARYSSLKVVIIDEISMVGRNMFNFINLRLQEIMACQKPFGNVSILAVGDLFQLKPVMDSWVFSQVFKTINLNSIATSIWVDLFDFFELTVIMRQKDDHTFAELLNRLREGLQTDEDMNILKSRHINSDQSNDHKNATHLFCTRKNAFLHNTSVLEKLPRSQVITIDAIDTLSGDINSSLHSSILSKIPDDSSKTMGLQKMLTLGVGVPADLCLNVDTQDGLTNGASCTIKKFDFRVPNSSRCSIIWVLFEDKSIGSKWRNRYKHLYSQGLESTWTPILETCRMFTYQHFKTYWVVRRQFPISLSAGKTIHKAQGSTMKEAVINLGTRKIDHIHYVGLSRVSSLSGVFITQLNWDKVSVSMEVEIEMERLRQQRQMKCCLPNLGSFEEVQTICFHNCRSLRKHIDNFRQEKNMLASDMIGLVETRAWDKVDYNIDGFKIISATCEEAPHGILVYVKETLNVEHIITQTVSAIEYSLIRIGQDLVIGFVYCPPKKASALSLTQLLSSISADITCSLSSQSSKLILMGDFNFEYTENGSYSRIFKQACHLSQLISSPTTDYGSCIDHIYTNLCNDDLIAFGTLESYYSDHKPLFLAYNLSEQL